MIQIIGKGGLGKEVQKYCTSSAVDSWSFEYDFSNLKKGMNAIIAIGDEEVRDKIVNGLPDQPWGILNFGKSYDYNNVIRQGSIICPGSILTTNVKIGRHCIVNLNCTIGHDTVVGDFVTVNPGVNISGNVTIGSNCNIGSNAVIRDGVSICDDVVIGAGGVVVKDITDPGVYVGNPVIRMDLRVKPVDAIQFEGLVKKIDALYKEVEGTRPGIVNALAERRVAAASILNAPPKPKK